jgi:hypothetical protein
MSGPEPKLVFRCKCGALLSSTRSAKNHFQGQTMCQRRDMDVYRRAPSADFVIEKVIARSA